MDAEISIKGSIQPADQEFCWHTNYDMTITPLKLILAFFCGSSFAGSLIAQQPASAKNWKVIIIRHAEKPPKGDNLDCQGLNRSLQLPELFHAKFGVPDYTYVPALGLGESTKHSRMFQTVIPLAAKYNLSINSQHDEKDSSGLASDIRKKEGTVLLVWEHHAIPSIVRALGVPNVSQTWDDQDFDSIWIISLQNGIPTLTKDKEGLTPQSACPN